MGFTYWSAREALPTTDGIVRINELDQPAKVRFDQSEVPYISAHSDKDMYMTQGFVAASERIFQMDILRRAALGRLSEVFGGSCLPHDKLVRTLGFNRMSRLEYAALSKEGHAALRAYTTGVNAYLEQSMNRLPLEFVALGYKPQSWQPQDTLAVLKFLQYQSDESWRLDEFRTRVLNKVGPDLTGKLFDQQFQKQPKQIKTSSRDALDLLPNVAQLLIAPKLTWGSSAWVVSGQVSNTHGCLLACDKHGYFSFPDLWFSCSLESENQHVVGATIAGIPGIIFGRNDKIAWAVNSFKADTQDLFVEEFSDKFPSKYKAPFGWSIAHEFNEEMSQRFGQNVLQKVSITKHGPVLIKNDTVGVALSWTGFQQQGSSLDTILSLNKTSDWAGFKEVLKQYSGSPQSFVFADTKGNIGLQVAGAIPLRKGDRKSDKFLTTQGYFLLSGIDDNSAWVSNLKFEDLPTSFNSPDGFIVADDTKYAGMALNTNPIPTKRVVDVLTQYRKSLQHPDLPEMCALQADQQAFLEGRMKSALTKSMKNTENIDVTANKALSLLNKSDGQVRGDSASAAIYESFMTTFLRRVAEPSLGTALLNEYVERWPRWSTFVGRVMEEKPTELLPTGERDYDTFMLTTFVESLKNLRLATKSDDPTHWTWKQLHQIDFREGLKHNLSTPFFLMSILFAPSTIGLGGDQDCVNNCDYQIDQIPWRYLSTSGPTIRSVIDMADDDKIYQTLTLGQSGHILSAHRNDQLRSWLNSEPHAIGFSEKQIERQLQHTLVLTNRSE